MTKEVREAAFNDLVDIMEEADKLSGMLNGYAEKYKVELSPSSICSDRCSYLVYGGCNEGINVLADIFEKDVVVDTESFKSHGCDKYVVYSDMGEFFALENVKTNGGTK